MKGPQEEEREEEEKAAHGKREELTNGDGEGGKVGAIEGGGVNNHGRRKFEVKLLGRV